MRKARWITTMALVAALVLPMGQAQAVRHVSVKIGQQWTEIDEMNYTVKSNFKFWITNKGTNTKLVRCWFWQVTEDHVWLNNKQINLTAHAGKTASHKASIKSYWGMYGSLWWIQHAGTHVKHTGCERAYAAPDAA